MLGNDDQKIRTEGKVKQKIAGGKTTIFNKDGGAPRHPHRNPRGECSVQFYDLLILVCDGVSWRSVSYFNAVAVFLTLSRSKFNLFTKVCKCSSNSSAVLFCCVWNWPLNHPTFLSSTHHFLSKEILSVDSCGMWLWMQHKQVNDNWDLTIQNMTESKNSKLHKVIRWWVFGTISKDRQTHKINRIRQTPIKRKLPNKWPCQVNFKGKQQAADWKIYVQTFKSQNTAIRNTQWFLKTQY